ncbi:carboxymuconolactone decarboxylase family protein [Mucilaginibacter aquariorum]|uniref:Carboxymuconolactone decarboxylase family protein n=1 Tax=Mucilaginibacter aquariorum TaxID=2967225 RepID=A0ABT1SXT7_9SPHI|nr:carboxymuconolactone decarboxylase family protein [Mucilaginibacter aquariorum]MCQ6957020.1 carboxymuconolactone decarboxylase family protein [Mucilaginibacter aquariorum]
MKKIKVPTRDEVNPDAQLLFDQVTKHLGKLPNLYATMGYSSGTLKGYLQFEAAMSGGVFTVKEKEAINLVVSEINNCDYCLAAHTMIAKSKGYTEEDTIGIRKGFTTDHKLDTVVKLAKSITDNRGEADPELLDAFFEAGYKEDALIELIGLITAKIFTNYVFAVTGVPLDFPEASKLDSVS